MYTDRLVAAVFSGLYMHHIQKYDDFHPELTAATAKLLLAAVDVFRCRGAAAATTRMAIIHMPSVPSVEHVPVRHCFHFEL